MALAAYQKKRNPKKTPEPRARKAPAHQTHAFVVQRHNASHLHYDFRLEVGGVLASWAVPKGMPKTTKEKHLAVRVEDHPYAYRTFEGVIPEGQYGAGTVRIYDSGTYRAVNAKSEADTERLMKAGLRKGEVSVILAGKKLKGRYALVKFRKPKDWLLIKLRI